MVKNSLFLVLFLWTFSVFGQNEKIKMKPQERSAQEVFSILENKYDFLFTYAENDIEGIKVQPPRKADNIRIFLSEILENTELKFEIVDQKFILISSKKNSSFQEKKYTLCGKVLVSETKEELAFASVYLKDTNYGLATELDGNFSFEAPLQATDTLVFSYVGSEMRLFNALEYVTRGCPEIALKTNAFGDDFIIVKEYLTDGIDSKREDNVTVIRPSQVGALPGQVEADVLQAIQFLPGISSPDGTAANISVRGGSADQNLILWEEIPAYHTAHYFGMISAFNPYIIESAEVYRSGFSADYGGRISGLIKLQSPDNQTQKRTYGIGINMLNAYAYGSLPFHKNKGNVTFSTRGSYSEWIETPTFVNFTRRIHQGVLLQTPTLGTIPEGIRIQNDFKSRDANLKLSYTLSDKDQVSFAWLYNLNDFTDLIQDDIVRKDQIDTFHLENSGISLQWERAWSSNFSSKLTALNMRYQNDYSYKITFNDNRRNLTNVKNSSVNEKQIHWSSTLKTQQNFEIKTGWHFINYDVGFHVGQIIRELAEAYGGEDLKTNLQTVYSTFKTDERKKIGTELGLRLSHFQKDGQWYLEPRLRLWYRPIDALEFHLNAGKYYQFLNQLSIFQTDDSGIDVPIWVLAGEEEVPVSSSTQLQGELIYRKNKWVINLQAYLKKIDGLTSLATGIDEGFGRGFNLGSNQIRGIDLLIKKRIKRFRTWLSYSLSDVQSVYPTFFDTTFSASGQQNNIIRWVNAYNLRGFQFSLGWYSGSGVPYSSRENFTIRERMNPPDAPPGVNLSIQPTTNEFNNANLPWQHRLDASVSYTYTPTNSNFPNIHCGLSLYNILNQRNAYERTLFLENLPNQQARLQYIDRVDLGFTPNFVLKFSW